MKLHKDKNRFGFTLIEVIVTIAILALISAIAVPSIIGFVENGKHINRNNIARTLYLASQNRLSEMRITKQLDGFNLAAGGSPLPAAADLSNEEEKNRNDLVYLSKPGGVKSGALYDMLEPIVLDKAVLNDAILVEYNTKTGAVLSVFYSETIDEFNYTDTLNMAKNISGERIYTFADQRKQGYYGVELTGAIPEEFKYVINIYDGYSKPLVDGLLTYKNVLYAEILMSKSFLTLPGGAFNTFKLKINDKEVHSKTFASLKDSLVSAVTEVTLPQDPLIYKVENPADPDNIKIIWVLDYVGNDMTTTQYNQHSIGVKYQAQRLPANDNITVGIQGTNINITSFTKANPYYCTEPKPAYNNKNNKIGSPRHLFNIRYNIGDKLACTQIDADPTTNENDNINMQGIKMLPLGDFAGTYIGKDFAIENLSVETPENQTFTGLFSRLYGKVYGLTLDKAAIKGSNNTGAIAGNVEGSGVISGCLVKESTIVGYDYVGGFTGYNSGQIGNSTFLSTLDVSPITNRGDRVGGIAGNNDVTGKMHKILYLAVAPSKGATIFPITGKNRGTAASNTDLYYLSGTPVYPQIASGEYNTKFAEGGGELKSTIELYEMAAFENWTKPPVIAEPESIESKIYPYQYFTGSKNFIPQYGNFVPNWPIVLADAVDADIKVDGYALTQSQFRPQIFDMPIPATTLLKYDRDYKYYNAQNGAFDDIYNTSIIGNGRIVKKEVRIKNSKETSDAKVIFDNIAFTKDTPEELMWIVIPGLLTDDLNKNKSVRDLVLAQMLKADAKFTKAEVQGMDMGHLKTAIEKTNNKTMHSLDATVPRYDPKNPTENHNIRYYTILYWIEDTSFAYNNNPDINIPFDITLKYTGFPDYSEKRMFKVIYPRFTAIPQISGFSQSIVKYSKAEYLRDFSLSINYTGVGATYLRIKINEEWMDKNGNILPSNNSIYTYSTQIYDNRKNDGYLYTMSPMKSTSNTDTTTNVIVRKAIANAPLNAIDVQITVFVDTVQYNLPYELWNLPRLPWN